MKNLFYHCMLFIFLSIVITGCSSLIKAPSVDGSDLENLFWDAVKNNDMEKIEEILADNFQGINSDEKMNRNDALDFYSNINMGYFNIHDMTSTQTGSVVNVTYYLQITGDDGHIKRKSAHASTWLYSDNRWVLASHSDLSRISEKEQKASKDIAVNAVALMAKSFSEASKHIEDPNEFIEYIRSSINGARFYDDKSGYFFVYDTTGLNIAHGNQPDLVGKDLIDFQDCKGMYVIQALIEKVQKDDSGFVKYYWLNPVTNTEDEKLGYVMMIPGTPYFIGDGVYYN